ncbi:MAG: hypothetical protein HW421_3590 [Ignavibacteria bacterium]|nr:hypothetical protein [Ignavibacteria bacterium]
MRITGEIIEKIIQTAKEYDIKKLVLFGSAFDSPENAHDIDLACNLDGMKIFSFAGRLEEELNISVDIVPLTKDNPFSEIVLRKGKVIYEVI